MPFLPLLFLLFSELATLRIRPERQEPSQVHGPVIVCTRRRNQSGHAGMQRFIGRLPHLHCAVIKQGFLMHYIFSTKGSRYQNSGNEVRPDMGI